MLVVEVLVFAKLGFDNMLLVIKKGRKIIESVMGIESCKCFFLLLSP